MSFTKAANSRSPHREVDNSAAAELGAGVDQSCARSAEVCNSSRKSLDIVARELRLFSRRRRLIWAASNTPLWPRRAATVGHTLPAGASNCSVGRAIKTRVESLSAVRNYALINTIHMLLPHYALGFTNAHARTYGDA